MAAFETRLISADYDVIAPDGSEIRLGPVLAGGSMVHCTLPPGAVTQAVRHKTVEEIWYVAAGHGQVWRKQADHSAVTDLPPGVFVTIPLGTDFQFRSTGDDALVIIMVTMPPWPGDDEAAAVEGCPEWE